VLEGITRFLTGAVNTLKSLDFQIKAYEKVELKLPKESLRSYIELDFISGEVAYTYPHPPYIFFESSDLFNA